MQREPVDGRSWASIMLRRWNSATSGWWVGVLRRDSRTRPGRCGLASGPRRGENVPWDRPRRRNSPGRLLTPADCFWVFRAGMDVGEATVIDLSLRAGPLAELPCRIYRGVCSRTHARLRQPSSRPRGPAVGYLILAGWRSPAGMGGGDAVTPWMPWRRGRSDAHSGAGLSSAEWGTPRGHVA